MPFGRSPWKGELSGRQALCACGESENKPFCDGSHARKGTGKKPHVVDLGDGRHVAVCQCGTSADAPFCDGSHRELPE